MDDYILQTDRVYQWSLIEEDLRFQGLTCKDIKWHKDLFFGECSGDAKVPWRLRFYYHSEPTMENWAEFFLQDDVELSDGDYDWLQSQFAGYLSWNRFSVHDLKCYFESVFGRVWKGHIEFPFQINRENKLREITVTPNGIISHFGRGAKNWLSAVRGSYDYNVMRFELDYFASILPLIDQRAFTNEKFTVRDRTGDGQGRVKGMQRTMQELLLYSHLPVSEYLSREQVDFAVQAREIILAYDGKPKEFNQIYDDIKAKVDRVEFEVLEGEGGAWNQIVYR